VGFNYLVSLVALRQVFSGLVLQAQHNTLLGDGVLGGGFEAGLVALVALACVVFSDFFSGLFHWSVDNYGDGRTPVFGGVIEAFQGHHSAPWTITYRPFGEGGAQWRRSCVVCAQLVPLLVHALQPTMCTRSARSRGRQSWR
jgi:hypothetical protein